MNRLLTKINKTSIQIMPSVYLVLESKKKKPTTQSKGVIAVQHHFIQGFGLYPIMSSIAS